MSAQGKFTPGQRRNVGATRGKQEEEDPEYYEDIPWGKKREVQMKKKKKKKKKQKGANAAAFYKDYEEIALEDREHHWDG